MIIPDLNVLLYAMDSDSPRHAEAVAWLEKEVNDSDGDIRLPWAVTLGFLRLVTTARVFPRPLSVDQALAWLMGLRANPTVRDINPGKAHMGILGHLLLVGGTGGNLATDAHLAALALENDATIVTGDRDFLRFPGVKIEFLY